jgi:D-alanine-D-alanine ligase
MNQPTLLLLFGGWGCEHEISLRSAAAVSDALRAASYPHHTVGITRQGAWYLFRGSTRQIADGSWESRSDALTAVLPCPGGFLMTDSGELLRDAVVFPCLHGTGGEDGRLQGLLELYGIPYIGCSAETSAICMNKSLTKDLLLLHRIPMAGKVAADIADSADATRLTNRAETHFLYPMFVKPARSGSSVGASIVHGRDECTSAIIEASRHDKTVMVERYVKGREVELAVLELAHDEKLLVSPPSEPIYRADFYDYNAKYQGKGAHLAIPARLPKHTADVLVALSKQIFAVLGCRHLARIDFFVGENGEVLFNEINTLPGMTDVSIFPAAMAYLGHPIASWLPALAKAALETAP